MADTTAISWTTRTFNPWRGCTKVSPGCDHCYMFTAQRKRQEQTGNFELWNPEIVQRTKTWGDPLRWQRAAEKAGVIETVFTCSWSDWFHNKADAWRPEAWDIIRRCPNLHFQILTKRAERMTRHLPPDWGEGYPNVWLGVSVESKKYLWRMDYLRRCPARVRFISAEPLLEDLELTPDQVVGIHQVIVGGESGPGYRPMDHEWARRILALCRQQRIAYFFKQSAAPRTEMGTKLDGRTYQEYPLDLVAEAKRVRYPQVVPAAGVPFDDKQTPGKLY
ncbi:MAG: phage Gp37/Gp68 family protein [Acidobacteria bacterium]|nr:phage Gp37/Gp68 family protein [Acidobacteriota bacterium]